MFERIVLAVDGSDQARGALAAAVDLARKSRGEVLVVHVHDLGPTSRETVDPETHHDARLLTDALLDVVIKRGVVARAELRSAPSTGVAKEILRAARGFAADTIVLGSRGLGEFAGILLGRVAHKVIQMSDCPVVVVRCGAAGAAGGGARREARVAAGRAAG
jgi:nucleotide-binding universal stress UspA family protein